MIPKTSREHPTAGGLIWAHNLRGATEGGQGTRQSTPTEALDPLNRQTTNQPKTPSTLSSLGAWPDLEPKIVPGSLTLNPSTPTLFFNTNCSSAWGLGFRVYGFMLGLHEIIDSLWIRGYRDTKSGQ